MSSSRGEPPHLVAAEFLAQLAACALPGIRLTPGQLSPVPGAFEPAWVEGLPLPVADARPATQTVALADGATFERVVSEDERVREHRDQPRTQVYESIHARSGGWPSLVTLHLAGLVRREVVCTLYQSYADDRTLGAHLDDWLGVIVQMRGAKRWWIWQSPSPQSSPDEIVMRAGDVLLLPKHMKHEVDTPADPGHSLHLVFAVMDESLDAQTRERAMST